MKTYYCVTNNYYDNGKVTAAITNTIEAAEIPKDTFKETKKCDVYENWFASKKEALKCIEECKKA